MSQIDSAWGAGPTPGYEALAEPFRALFASLAEGAIERELDRRLPWQELQSLKDAGFTAVRVPVEYGGRGANLPELFNLLIELGAADSNLVQALRGHFGFVEDVLNHPDPAYRQRWLERLGRGEVVGPATGEIGQARQAQHGTQLQSSANGWRLNGSKFYTTGSLYSDWIFVSASGPDGERLGATVRSNAPGVEVIDDWNGFGQTLTASGTAHFRDVHVDPANVVSFEQRFGYSPAFYQMVHLANLAGIGRAQTNQVARAVAQRTRSFSNGNADRVANDPQVLQVVGQVRGAAYGAGAIVLKIAEALQRAHVATLAGDTQAIEQAVIIAELEVAQSQTLVSQLILDASTLAFDALSASATLRPQGLDRFWRNARTLSSHNPRFYKDRIVGDYAVNGTAPPGQWKIGVA
ncbi:acyl-CoA dehydrogenase family protein [Pseudomonas sp. nanlin1]|uniref:acyl-CoA dehydrogenase family protein n=1 Tax=Pseudomonas sp. nanlin1 TaxID=3040605 RepID=UPI00388F348F